MVLVHELRELGDLAVLVVEKDVKFGNVCFTFLALPVFDWLVVVATIGVLLQLTFVLVLLAYANFLEQVIFLGVQVGNAADQREGFGHLTDLFADVKSYFVLDVVHDLGHALVVEIFLGRYSLRFILVLLFGDLQVAACPVVGGSVV